MIKYDVLIIGAGPIGLACGLAAKRANLSYLIVDKGTLVNSLYNYPLNMTFFSSANLLEIGEVPFVTTHTKPNRTDALEYYRRVAESTYLNINLFENVVSIKKEANTEGYHIETTKQHYTAQNVILACGFYDIPKKLGIIGEDLPKVTHYYKEPHFYYNQNVIVVGASNSAVDAALETYRKGANVTMIIRGHEVGHRVKYWSRPDIVNRLEEGSIKVYYNAKLREIRQNHVDIETNEGVLALENDFVIAAIGYQPNFDFLRKTGILLTDDEKLYPSYNPETQETNLKNIYLAGVICGGMDTHVWFIENSRIHAEMIIKNILKNQHLTEV